MIDSRQRKTKLVRRCLAHAAGPTKLLLFLLTGAVTAVLLAAAPVFASDHADPIDPFNRERLEGGITDLFVFPVDENGKIAFPFERTPAAQTTAEAKSAEPLFAEDLPPELSDTERGQIKALIVILCVRRQLTQTGSLRLEPYTYKIHMDLNSKVSYGDTPADIVADKERNRAAEAGSGYQPGAGAVVGRPTGREARLRYGGTIQQPEDISETVTIELRLNNDAKLNGAPNYVGLKNTGEIQCEAGVFDDPFIFPAFFGTNVVGMVLKIPITCFDEGKRDWIVWATSHKGRRQVDHVGRSLRTQNPRFDFLNTLPPSKHVATIKQEHEHPSLLRDIALRFNMQSIFAYRKWDFVPDVMIYTNRYRVGFPNGRLPTDDVAALLAKYGDTLLLELSHHTGGWPRRTTNDKEFGDVFPFLAKPWPDKDPIPPPSLSTASKLKLIGIVLLLIVLFVLENWLVAYWYCRRKTRRRLL